MGTQSYDVTTLSTNAKNRIRLAIGDWQPDAMTLDDEAIVYVLSVADDERTAAVTCCGLAIRAIANDSVNYHDGVLSEDASQRIKNFRDIQQDLAQGQDLFNNPGHVVAAGIPIPGGIVIADEDAMRFDTSVNQPRFDKHRDKNPRVTNFPDDDTDLLDGNE